MHFTAQKSKRPRRFWELDPEILYTCSMCPCRAFYESFFFQLFCFFSPKMWDILRPKYPQKTKKTNIWRKKENENKKKSFKARQGHTKHMRKISRSNSQKRRGHWHLKELGFYAWTSLYVIWFVRLGAQSNNSFVRATSNSNLIWQFRVWDID